MERPFCAVDYETYYDNECSVKPLGTVAYTLHPKFDAYMVSIWCPSVQYVGHPRCAPWDKIKGFTWISHNAGFDQAVHRWWIKQPACPQAARFMPIEWQCTSALAVYLGAPRDLAKASKFLLKKEMNKGMRTWMKGKTWHDCIAAGNEKKSGRPYSELLSEYALLDSENCYQIWDKYQHHWPENERLLSKLTYDDGARGVYIDLPLLRKNLKHIVILNDNAENDIPWVHEGEKPTSPKALRRYCADAGIPAPVSVDENDDRYILWEDKYGSTVDWVAKMRTWRKTNTLRRRLETMYRRVQDGTNCMSYSLKYFGGHTGRWSGDEGFNMQNPQREETYGVNVRHLIRARPGMKFVITDWAQIEPRILAWACGDVRLLDQIRQGFAIYEAHARNTMGWTGGKLKKEDPRKYSLAKARVLSLGYGAGAEKFVVMARTVAGLYLLLSEALQNVNQFRSSNPLIMAFWNRIEMAFKRAGLRKAGEPNIFHMELPSGRVMRYLNVQINSGSRAQTTMGGLMKKFWGGKLTENFVQATARDVFAGGLVALHKAKIPTAFHLHDEYVNEVPKNFDAEEIRGIVTQRIPGLDGCPLEVEIQESDHYKK